MPHKDLFNKKKYMKKYYQDNKEKILDGTRKYYQDNKEKILDSTRKYYQDNKEKISTQYKKYYQDNREKILARNRKYHNKIFNIKKYTDISIPFLNKKISNMKERSNDVTLTAEELLELIPKDLKCPVFGTKFSFGEGNNWKFRQNSMSVDRIDNNKGYHKDNIVIVSFKANVMKSSATLNELYQVADFYYELEKRSKSSA
tara:strand:- start:2045 stop:2647 length:603 start_codon:yes stop_codon:yes gene_type:complete